ncbi:Gfo/Idh/MocA family oxidoreductase [bacterium]|nr:Gfo/Idh/MocA family oxidoreductase [bacterium]
MLKVGVIGAGSMGRHHVRVYSELENCRLVGVADPDPGKQELADKHGTQLFTDYHALLEQGPDLVSIAAPTVMHYQAARDAISAGCHLLVEKPISDDLAKAQELVELARAAGKIIAIGHIERFNPAVSELKQIIASGELGEVLTVNNLRVGPYHGRIADTGIVLDLGTHDVDLISYLLDARAESVFCNAMQRVHNHEDHAVLQMQFPAGRTGIIETSWLAPYRARNIFCVGTKHFALCDLMNQLILVYEDNPEGNNLLAGLRHVERGEPLKRELEHVVQCVMDGSQPLCTAEDSIYALSVCLAALKSIEIGASVAVGAAQAAG